MGTMIQSFKQFKEATEKGVVFTFGRFNPPTTGHEKLMKKVTSLAKGNDYKIFASQSNDAKKNPLGYKEKVQLLRKIFPKYGRNIVYDKKIKNSLDALVYLYKQGYTKVTMVVGADRIPDFKKLLNKYNGEKSRHGYYDFSDGISIVSAGERDPDSDDVSGMSASKMRAAASSGDFKSFAKGLPDNYGDKIGVFNLLRSRMGLKEMTNFRTHIELATTDLREKYVAGEVFNEGDEFLNEHGNVLVVLERKSNFIIGSDENKYFINKIQEVRQDPDVKDKKGTQPAKYYAGIKTKSTKDKRDAHFKKGAKKDDDDPSAYKPAPGDKGAKTKPSKHTKKFKDMFGEDKNPIVDTENSVEEGVNDPAIFKAVFLAGGPGSGKSFTIGKTGLQALGFKLINSDDNFEKAIKKAGATMDPDFIYSPKGQDIRNKAKALTARQQEMYLKGRLGLVIDGTGKNYEKIKKQARDLEALGYDTAMIFVNTNLETAVKRDSQRSRTLGAKAVEKMWAEVQKNIGKFQSLFNRNFQIVDNSEGANWQKATTDAYKKMAKFAKKTPTNKIARDWIKKQLGEDIELSEEGIEENVTASLKKKAKKSGMPLGILRKVYNRGVAAWRTGHRPGTNPTQWGLARVNSFATKSKGTWGGADKDLAAKAR
jgi:shikimate kinase/phosphopantetheine adenylyltransferase